MAVIIPDNQNPGLRDQDTVNGAPSPDVAAKTETGQPDIYKTIDGIESTVGTIKSDVKSRIEETIKTTVAGASGSTSTAEAPEAEKEPAPREKGLDDLRLATGHYVIAQGFTDALRRIKAGEKINPRDTKHPSYPYAAILLRFKNENEKYYNALANSSISKLVSSNCIDAILSGTSINLEDEKGVSFPVFIGGELGKGGFGRVANVARLSGDGNSFVFGALKMPLPHDEAKKMFEDERAGAKERLTWDDPYIIKADVIGNNFIIYETGEETMDLRDAMITLPPDVLLPMMSLLEASMETFRKHNRGHGDLKPANILIFIETKPDGKKIYTPKIIDVAPFPAEKILAMEYGHTISYFPLQDELDAAHARLINEKKLSKEEADRRLTFAVDAYSRARIIERTLVHQILMMTGVPVKDRVSLKEFADQIDSANMHLFTNGKRSLTIIPRFPVTSSPDLNRLADYINDSHDLLNAGDPVFWEGYRNALDNFIRKCGGNVPYRINARGTQTDDISAYEQTGAATVPVPAPAKTTPMEAPPPN